MGNSTMVDDKADNKKNSNDKPVSLAVDAGEHAESAKDSAGNAATKDTANKKAIDRQRQQAAAEAAASKNVTGGQRARGSRAAWLAVLLALMALGGSAYQFWLSQSSGDQIAMLEELVDHQRQQAQRFQNAVDKLQSDTQAALSSRDQDIAAVKLALTEANAMLEGHARRLLSLTATTTDDWRLAEVEYLLRLANQRILISKDGVTALSLLGVSDQILLELGDPRLLAVREAIANDRAAISLVGQHDLEGVFLELSALAKQINQLPLLIVPEFVASQNQAAAFEDASQTAPQWLQKIEAVAHSTWNELKSLIVVQRGEVDIKPLLPPEQQYYLRSNLRLLLNQAQLALLDGRQQPYRESLSIAVGWLRDYFPQSEEANRQMLAAIERLADIPVSSDYPDVSASLMAIKAFIAEQHRISAGHVPEQNAQQDKSATEAAKKVEKAL